MVEPSESPQLGQLESLVIETYGLPLLAYLLATDELTVRRRLDGSQGLHAAAEEVLTQQLAPLAQRVASQIAAEPNLPRSFSLDILGQPVGDGTMSIGIALRRASGGDIPDELATQVADDPVKLEATRMAIDTFPLLLVPVDPHWPMPRVSLFQHPSRANLQAAVQADTDLRRLFTEDDPGLGRRGYYYTSLGHGSGVQDVMFGEMIIASAWDMVTMTTASRSLVALIHHVHQNIDTLRAAVGRRESEVPALVVFTGFKTQDNQQIRTPWGLLRPLHDWERELAPEALEGAISGGAQDDSPVTVSYAGEMVLETQLPYNLIVSASSESGEVPPWPTIIGSGALRRSVAGIQLAMLLATERPAGNWVTARVAWTWRGDPFGHGSNIGWSDARSLRGFMPYEIPSSECEAVREWASKIETGWTRKIDIAVRRLLSAANARTDMADRLVDSVIVWENLFGTSQGEPRLRISASMAWLLAQDQDARAALQAKLKGLYDYRSKIVHGGDVEAEDLADSANDAMSYARDALRSLFGERRDVLALPDGASRSLRLILGG